MSRFRRLGSLRLSSSESESDISPSQTRGLLRRSTSSSSYAREAQNESNKTRFMHRLLQQNGRLPKDSNRKIDRSTSSPRSVSGGLSENWTLGTWFSFERLSSSLSLHQETTSETLTATSIPHSSNGPYQFHLSIPRQAMMLFHCPHLTFIALRTQSTENLSHASQTIWR